MKYRKIKSYSHLFKPNIEEEIIRVNHAGELGAKYIYEGQLKILSEDREIIEMLEGELKHLEYFENKIREKNIRPSFFNGFWRICAYGMGFFSARLGGRKVAMLCTVKVEEVIEKHYEEQIELLEEGELKENIAKFREEEIHHMEVGKQTKKDIRAIEYLFTFCTKFAIAISKRF